MGIEYLSYIMKIKKRYGRSTYLSKVISVAPIKINIEDVKPDGMYTKATDEIFIFGEIVNRSYYIYSGLGVIIFLSLVSALVKFNYVGIIMGSIIIFMAKTVPQQLTILDRKNGLITIPNSILLWGKPITIPFNDALFAWSLKNFAVAPGPPKLSVVHPNGWTSTDIGGGEIERTLSFIVWYMDKNRPLPLGTAFDEYREKDYLRRKAEKFPAPLYHSTISIQEAKQKWQKERQKIGGW